MTTVVNSKKRRGQRANDVDEALTVAAASPAELPAAPAAIAAPAAVAVAATAEAPTSSIECTVCGDAIAAFGVFDCGHFACHKCALRVRRTIRKEEHNNLQQGRRPRGNGAGVDDDATAAAEAAVGRSSSSGATCHVCRQDITTLCITEMRPARPDTLMFDKPQLAQLATIDATHSKRFLPLKCLVTSDACAARLLALIDYVCPFDQCWNVDPSSGRRSQQPFVSFDQLQRHLRSDHGVRFCEVCVAHGYSFLSELPTYSTSEMHQHTHGVCGAKDVSAFSGHPMCNFCHNKLLYDGDAMLEHLKRVHWVCDFCNINTYKFTYYNDRAALLRHWEADHKLCTHADCAQLDAAARVFASDLDLSRHMLVAHNVRQTVSLESLGFRMAGSDLSGLSGGGGGGSSSSGASQQQQQRMMQAAASLHTTMITYDFVGRTVTVPLVPKATAMAFAAGHDGGGGSGAAGGRGAGRRAPRGRGGAGAGVGDGDTGRGAARPAAAGAAAAAAAAVGSGGEAAALPLAVPASAASAAAEEERQRLESANERLRALVEEKLSKKQRDEFNDATLKFVREQLKAVEYFAVLQRCFGDGTDALEEAFNSFAETLRKHGNPQLRDALVAAKSMATSAEVVRAKQVVAEDAQARVDADRRRKHDEIRRLHQQAMQDGSGGGNAQGRGGGGSGGGGVRLGTMVVGGSGGAAASNSGGARPVTAVSGGNVWQQRQQASTSSSVPVTPTAPSAAPSLSDLLASTPAPEPRPAPKRAPRPATATPSGAPTAAAAAAAFATPAAAVSAALDDPFPSLTTSRRNNPPAQPKLRGVWKNHSLS
jgi:hypothetical protein